MSVHVDNGGMTMTLKYLRRFVEYTKNYDENTSIRGGFVGKHLRTQYDDLMGLETK
jgi:hypothetical protein